jgi:predicted nucleic acid-binding protein
MVLVEVLNALASYGPHLRQAAEGMVRMIVDDAAMDVVPQTRKLFQNAYVIYGSHPDKEWSLTDCASFVIMDQKKITDVLTSDYHFEQKGYRALLRE